MPDLPPRRAKADASTLRRWFNEMDLWGRALRGELTTVVRQDKVRHAYLSRDEPTGTRVQILEYWEGQTRVAVVFQYMRPDSSLGASGRPDPKLVLKDGIEYVLAVTSEEP